MNLPNALTLFRILLVPAFLVAVIYGRWLPALVLFLAAAGTDLLDGMLARRRGEETVLGSFLDPVADKLLMTVSFISLSVGGIVPPWLAVVAVSKDLFVGIGVAILYFSGQRVASVPTIWGKQTTFLQVVTVTLALLFVLVGWRGAILTPLYALTGLVTALSGLHYIVSGIRALPPETGRKGPDHNH